MVGSKLLGQNFNSPQYFQGRLCAEEVSGGTNFGSTNQTWLDEVKNRVKKIKAQFSLSSQQDVPSDLVTISSSGLDPHIGKASAYLQIANVAKARHVSEDKIKQIIDQEIKKNSVLFFGEELVNVLQLNIALDTMLK